MTANKLKFRDLSPLIDVSFWFQLEHRKLHQWKLEEPEVPVALSISSAQRNAAKLKVPNTAYVTGSSFEVPSPASASASSSANGPSYAYKSAASNTILGYLTNFNTPQQLDSLDKKAALQTFGNEKLAAPLRAFDWAPYEQSALAEKSPAEVAALARECAEKLTFLNATAMWTFADLKAHNFQYIIAFPAIDLESPVACTARHAANEHLTEAQLAAVLAAANNGGGKGKEKEEDHITQHQKALNDDTTPFVAIVDRSANQTEEAAAVTTILPFTPSNATLPNAVVVFNDTSEMKEHPGWFIRNLLAAVRLAKPDTTRLTFLGLRDALAPFASNASVVFELSMEPLVAPTAAAEAAAPLKIVGWSTKAIESVAMGAMMDPAALAESSSRLNLSLMKWRMMPALDLEKIQNCKALLLGSGTLGCNIARHLLMWGVTDITMVDRGRVSYSNPVRQTLFEVEDVVQGRTKCDAAVAALKRILPTVKARSVNMTIRMPGHRVHTDDAEEVAKCREDVALLEELIKEADVVFELTDSREARWLPTVLATYHNKPVINTALGFDAYVVMRHGLRSSPDGERLGCYFCNDVVAPVDSLTARTLDMQCTVTRPGVSAMASALTVEMLASLYNHPKFFGCPSYKASEDGGASHAHGSHSASEFGPAESCLGIVPHQIRGSVADYSQMAMHGVYFPKCAACSEPIMKKYEEEGFDFILRCLNNSDYIEEVTGLKADKELVEKMYANAGASWDDDGWDE